MSCFLIKAKIKEEWTQQNHYASEKQILDAAAIPSDVSFAILSNVEIDQTEDKFLAKIPVDKLKVINVKILEGNESLLSVVRSGKLPEL